MSIDLTKSRTLLWLGHMPENDGQYFVHYMVRDDERLLGSDRTHLGIFHPLMSWVASSSGGLDIVLATGDLPEHIDPVRNPG